jgi:hypothetical protein
MVLLIFESVLAVNDYAFQSRNKDNNNNVAHRNTRFKSSTFSTEQGGSATRRKRQVELRMNGVQHIYENPQRNYGYQNVEASQGQAEFGGSASRDLSGDVAAQNSMNVASMVPQNPEVDVEQATSRSFGGGVLNKWSQTQKNMYAPVPQSSQVEETNSQTSALNYEHLPGSSPLYNKENVLNPQTDGANGQRNSPNLPVTSNILNEDKSVFSPSQAELDKSVFSPLQAELANMKSNPQENFSSDSTISDPPTVDSSMSPPPQQKTFVDGNSQEHPFPNPQTLPANILNPQLPLPVDPHTDDITAHEFVRTPPIGDPSLDLVNPHTGPVIHPDAPPQVLNPLGPDNIHIIKKFYPLPVVQKVPKPVPVFVTKPVPYPVPQTRFQHVPQPYPEPFSKPDVHLSHIHFEERGRPKVN